MERKNMVNLSVVGTYCIFYLFFLLDLNLRAADRGFVSLPKVNTDSLVVSGYWSVPLSALSDILIVVLLVHC